MEVLLRKLPTGAMAPMSEEDAEKLRRIKVGAGVRCDVKQMRNPDFHRRYFALITFLFGIWEETMPREQYWRGIPIMANKDKFRKDLTILTGRCDATYNVKGDVQLEAHSISFAKMDQEEFEKLYSDTIQVALEKVIHRPDLNEAAVRQIVEELLRFD